MILFNNIIILILKKKLLENYLINEEFNFKKEVNIFFLGSVKI